MNSDKSTLIRKIRPVSYISLVLLIFLFFIIGCHGVNRETEFNWDGWTKKDDGFYTQRKWMVKDVISHKLKMGMTYNEIINLLGKPDYESFDQDNEIHYEILEKYGWDIDPEEIRYLDLKFDRDSTLIESRIRITK